MTSRYILAILLCLSLAPALIAASSSKSKKKSAKKTAQQKTEQQKTKQQKLTKTQQEQLKVYKQINTLVQQKKYNQEVFYKSTYSPIQKSCKDMENRYVKLIEKLQKQQQSLLEDGATEKQVKELADKEKVYKTIVKSLKKIQTAIDTKNPLQANQAINEYLKQEEELKKKHITYIKREWFSPKELETYTPEKNK